MLQDMAHHCFLLVIRNLIFPVLKEYISDPTYIFIFTLTNIELPWDGRVSESNPY